MNLVLLGTVGVVCHAQRPRLDASGVTRCEAALAKCQAVLGAVGANAAEDTVRLAAIFAKSGTASSASKGAPERRRIAWHAWAAGT